MRALLVVVLITMPLHAFADDDGYRLQTAAVDGITIGLGVGTFKTEGFASDHLFEAALGSLVIGAPTVHLLHKRWGRAATSLGLRIGLPLAGIALGGFFGSPCLPQHDCDAYNHRQIEGLVVGALAAMVFDTTFLAGPDEHSGPTIAPAVGAASGGMSFGVAGTF